MRNNFFLIASFTIKEILKSRVLYGVLSLGSFIAIFSYLASEFTFGVPQRVAIDIGMGGVSLSSLAIALFFGATLLTKEIETRTIYMTLSRPVARGEYILAKITGLIIVLGINIIILSIFTLGVFFILGGEGSPLLYWTLFFSFLESSLLMVLVVLLSLVTNTTLTVIAGGTIYGIGYMLSSALINYFINGSQKLEWIISIATFIIPDFDRLNIKEYLLYEQTLSTSFLLGSTAYASVYILVLVGFILLIFRNKELV